MPGEVAEGGERPAATADSRPFLPLQRVRAGSRSCGRRRRPVERHLVVIEASHFIESALAVWALFKPAQR
jgi:hypothetical protein